MDRESPEVTAVGPTLILPFSFSRLVPLGTSSINPSHPHTHTQSRSGIHFMRHSCSIEKMLGSGHMIVVLTEHSFISLVTAQRSSKCVNQRLGLADTFVHL